MPFKYRGPGQTKAKVATKVGLYFGVGFSLPFGIAYYQMCVLSRNGAGLAPLCRSPRSSIAVGAAIADLLASSLLLRKKSGAIP